MKESAIAWQEKAIRSTNEAAADNKNVFRDIKKSEASNEAKELRKQLETLNEKHADLQTEHNFTSAALLALKNKMNGAKDTSTNTTKITELTMELGEQRKLNEDLQKKSRELLEGFTSYKARHLKDQLDTDVKGKRNIKKESFIEEESDKGSRTSHSPTWGSSRKDITPSSSDREVKEKSSTSQSDNGWGSHHNRQRGKTRPPYAMINDSKSLNPGMMIEMTPGTEKGVVLLRGVLTQSKGSYSVCEESQTRRN
jgi:hypothetical protein